MASNGEFKAPVFPTTIKLLPFCKATPVAVVVVVVFVGIDVVGVVDGVDWLDASVVIEVDIFGDIDVGVYPRC